MSFSTDPDINAIPVVDLWPGVPAMNGASIKHNDQNAFRVLMAYTLEEGKSPRDYQDYRSLLDGNILKCGGTRWATLFTEPSVEFPYDIVDDMTFPSGESLECFLTPTERMKIMAPDLFGSGFVLVSVEVEEQGALFLGGFAIDGERIYYGEFERE